MITQKLWPSGAWQVSEVIDGALVTRTYYFSTKKEAISAFRAEQRELLKARRVKPGESP